MQKFEILLKNEKLKLYNRFSLFILIILTLLYVYFTFFAKPISSVSTRYIILAFMILFLVAFYLKKSREIIKPVHFYFFLILGWALIGEYLLAGVTLLLQLLLDSATGKKMVTLSADKIIYPSFPKRIIYWADLNNLLLKDGLLTIDLKSNKVIQQLVDENKTPVDEKEFNDFCRQQLNK